MNGAPTHGGPVEMIRHSSRGAWRADAPLKGSNWFQVGGPAEWLFKPQDAEDLAGVMARARGRLPIWVLGVGSNLIIRDGGLEGVTIRLGRGFVEMSAHEHEDGWRIRSGAGALARNLALFAAEKGLGGLEFMIGIPGTVGGLVAMNAGAYGADVSGVLAQVQLAMPDGTLTWRKRESLPMSYRKGGLPEGAIVTAAEFHVRPADAGTIRLAMDRIAENREATQPIREKTGGSTFKNPEGHKAWQLIDAAGCRGLKRGEAMISDKHCNFMINTGNATAADLEALGEEVRERVQAKSGILLEWEIKRIGKPPA